MVEANVIKYISRQIVFGGEYGDRTHEFPCKAIYVPSEEIIVMRDQNSIVYSGPAHLIYKAYLGPSAQQAYNKLVGELKNAVPEKIDVPQTFVTWAKALHHTLNPSTELTDLLNV